MKFSKLQSMMITENTDTDTDDGIPVWVVSGRDATNYRDGKLDKIKEYPQNISSFKTEAEAVAYKKGLRDAIVRSLNNVAFIDPAEVEGITTEVKKKKAILQDKMEKKFAAQGW